MTTATATAGKLEDGRTWELIRAVSPNGYNPWPAFLVRLDGEGEIWLRTPTHDEIRRALDPAWAARQDEIARKRAEEEAALAQLRAEKAALLARCQREARQVYIRFGFARSGYRSLDHRDNRQEAGLSVYPGWLFPDGSVVLDLRDICFASFLFSDFRGRQAYVASGNVVGTGADGEPLLGRFTLKKIHIDSLETI